MNHPVGALVLRGFRKGNPMPESSFVLIVEDDMFQAIHLEELLIDGGYQTQLAGSVSEVEEILANHSPAAALVDMRLTDGMTGPEIARRLDGLGVAVIIHSGQTTDFSGVPAMAHLVKPASNDRILSEVERAVSQTHQPRKFSVT